MQHAAVNRKSVGSRLDTAEGCVGYGVYGPLGQRIGKAEKVFVNGSDEPEYVRVKMGLFGCKSVLIPVESVAIDEERKVIALE
jgi:hypothetical protein